MSWCPSCFEVTVKAVVVKSLGLGVNYAAPFFCIGGLAAMDAAWCVTGDPTGWCLFSLSSGGPIGNDCTGDVIHCTMIAGLAAEVNI